MDKTQQQLIEELAIQLFGTAEPYCYLALNTLYQPVLRLHTGYGDVLQEAIFTLDDWQVCDA